MVDSRAPRPLPRPLSFSERRASRAAAYARRANGNVRRRPGRLMAAGFALVIGIGTLLLTSRAATAGEGGFTSVLDALFTATSAVCVTGLIVVDTPTHWSTFGQVVILALIQVGGLGILFTASVLGLAFSRRLGLQTRLSAAAETRTVRLGELPGVLLRVVVLSLTVEATVAVVLALRFWGAYGYRVGEAAWLGVFHAISAFNNAGFALWSNNLMGFATDPWICLPIALAVIVGGIGFPVLLELRRHLRPARWSLHTKLTLSLTAILLLSGWVFVTVAEWGNPATLGPFDVGGKLLAGFFQGTMPRTAGFNSVDIAGMNTGTLFGVDLLMLVGGGSAGTAGGLKVTTVAVLTLVTISELRGDPDVSVFDRRILASGQRQALAVAMLGLSVVAGAALMLAMTTPYSLDEVLYESISAFSLVGLSTGITPSLEGWQQILLVVLMFVGRLGPVTFASALAMREHGRLIRHPEGMPIIG